MPFCTCIKTQPQLLCSKADMQWYPGAPHLPHVPSSEKRGPDFPATYVCSDLEKSVERIQKDLAHNHRLIPVQELEEKALVLKQLGETLTELKGERGSGEEIEPRGSLGVPRCAWDWCGEGRETLHTLQTHSCALLPRTCAEGARFALKCSEALVCVLSTIGVCVLCVACVCRYSDCMSPSYLHVVRSCGVCMFECHVACMFSYVCMDCGCMLVCVWVVHVLCVPVVGVAWCM